jgi:nucleoside-diphosphate-sugar epimerase
MIISIAGATGFVGSRLLAECSKLDNEIRYLSRKKRKSIFNAKLILADLDSTVDKLVPLFDDVSIFYNCAGEVKNTSLMYKVHVDGTALLLEAVKIVLKEKKKPIHWVQLSSVGAYGPPEGAANTYRVVTEETPEKPNGEYEVTKTLADQLVVNLAQVEPLFTYTILRPSNVIAADMPNQSIRSLVKTIQKGLFFYVGTRSAVATYIHVDDVVAALLKCGNDIRARGHTFNLSNDCALTEIVSSIAQASGISKPRLRVPENCLRFLTKILLKFKDIPLTQSRIDALVKHTYYPFTKIEKVIGFVPQHDIPQSIISMFVAEKN